MTATHTIEGMPRLTSDQRVSRAQQAIAAAVAALESDLEKGRYDEAWRTGEELARVLDEARTVNSQARGRIIATMRDHDRLRLDEIAARLGRSVSWVAKLSAAAKGKAADQER